MERNEFTEHSTQAQSDGAAAGSAFGAGGNSTRVPNDDVSLADRAKEVAGSAQEKLAEAGSTVRERAGNLKDTIADALESNADKLRQRSTGGTGGGGLALAGATDNTSTAVQSDGRLAEVGTKVAGGMDAAAGWLRDADIEGMKSGIERQVKEHPGRTLLIAAGLGYLLGKALRK